MTYTSLLYLFIITLGLIVYFRKPSLFFMYWLSTHAFVVPLFFVLFNPSYSGNESFSTFYFGFLSPLCYLLILISAIEYYKNRTIDFTYLYVPLVLLLIFFVVQNLLTGFNVGPLIANTKEVFFMLLPTISLSVSQRIRPNQKTLIRFIFVFIVVQAFFCLLNLYGVRLYSNYAEVSTFADEYICGSFDRYSHLTNYLTTMFLLLSIFYFVNNLIPKSVYIAVSFLLCVIILASGARISVVLFFVILGLSLLFYRRKNIIMISSLAISFLCVALYFSSKFDIGTQNADDGTGLERNVTGLVDLFTSNDTDDNTLGLSGFLFLTNFHNPLFGNGYAYRETHEYDMTEDLDESVMRTDARMAYMVVEYGLIGCLLFVYLFYGIIKTNIFHSGIVDWKMWTIVIVYYVFFTFTETGLFDLIQLSMISILCFSYNTVNSESLDIDENAKI